MAAIAVLLNTTFNVIQSLNKLQLHLRLNKFIAPCSVHLHTTDCWLYFCAIAMTSRGSTLKVWYFPDLEICIGCVIFWCRTQSTGGTVGWRGSNRWEFIRMRQQRASIGILVKMWLQLEKKRLRTTSVSDKPSLWWFWQQEQTECLKRKNTTNRILLQM